MNTGLERTERNDKKQVRQESRRRTASVISRYQSRIAAQCGCVESDVVAFVGNASSCTWKHLDKLCRDNELTWLEACKTLDEARGKPGALVMGDIKLAMQMLASTVATEEERPIEQGSLPPTATKRKELHASLADSYSRRLFTDETSPCAPIASPPPFEPSPSVLVVLSSASHFGADLAKLAPGCQLDGKVIHNTLAVLTAIKGGTVRVLDQEVTTLPQNMQILLPVCTDSHWRLGCVSVSGELTVYDSFPHLRSIKSVEADFDRYRYFTRPLPITVTAPLLQSNEDDCGVFLLATAFYVTADHHLPSKIDAGFWRTFVKRLLQPLSGHEGSLVASIQATGALPRNQVPLGSDTSTEDFAYQWSFDLETPFDRRPPPDVTLDIVKMTYLRCQGLLVKSLHQIRCALETASSACELVLALMGDDAVVLRQQNTKSIAEAWVRFDRVRRFCVASKNQLEKQAMEIECVLCNS